MRRPAIVVRLVCLVRLWRRRWRSRRELDRVEPRLLRDAGISVLDARQEARKPFWRP